MSKETTPLSWRITTGQMLEALRYYSGNELKAEQTKLSGAATQLEKITTGKLGSFLEYEEREIIRQAAVLVRQLNIRVEHAKETKVREEKRSEKERKEFSAACTKAIAESFPDVSETDDLLSLIEHYAELHLGLYKCGFLSTHLNNRAAEDIGKEIAQWSQEQPAWHQVRRSVLGSAKGILYHLKYDVEHVLLFRSGEIPKAVLSEALEKAGALRTIIRAENQALFKKIDQFIAIEKSTNVERLQVKKAGS